MDGFYDYKLVHFLFSILPWSLRRTRPSRRERRWKKEKRWMERKQKEKRKKKARQNEQYGSRVSMQYVFISCERASGRRKKILFDISSRCQWFSLFFPFYSYTSSRQSKRSAWHTHRNYPSVSHLFSLLLNTSIAFKPMCRARCWKRASTITTGIRFNEKSFSSTS